MRLPNSTACLAALILAYTPLVGAAFEIVRFERELRSSLDQPVDVAVTDTGDVLVLDGKSRQVLVYSAQGELRGTLGDQAELSRPVAVAAGPEGLIAVGDNRERAVFLFDAEGNVQGRFGGAGKEPGQFGNLLDVDVDHFGFIYTADDRNRCVSRFTRQGILLAEACFSDIKPGAITVDRQGVVHMLADDGPAVYRFSMNDGAAGARKIQFSEKTSGAGGVYVDTRGDLYLTRSGKNNVLKFDRQGSLLTSFGSRGKNPGAFSRPTRMDGDRQGRLYVVDSRNERIQVFSTEGSEGAELPLDARSDPTVSLVGFEPLGEAVDDLVITDTGEQLRLFGDSSRILKKGLSTAVFGAPGRDSGELREPRGVAALPGDRLIVADTGNHRMQIFQSDGSARVIGERGREPGFFYSPSDVAVNSDGIVYVADADNARVQMFTDQGIYLHSFGEEGTGRGEDQASLSQFGEPTALAIDRQDRVHVVDPPNQRVVTFDDRGQPIQVIIGLSDPVDVAVDEQNNIYVADNTCHCVLVYGSDGRLLLRFGSSGDGPGQLGTIRSLAAVGGQVLVYQQGAGGSDPLTSLIASALGDSGSSGNDGGIKTFRLDLDGMERSAKIRVQHSYYVPAAALNDPRQLAAYRDIALDTVVEELAQASGAREDIVRGAMRVEREEALSGGEMRISASVPAELSAVAPNASREVSQDTSEPDEESEVELAF